ncbi:hypothetical protein quinque_013037 [Culex quinquefasciatus]
MDSPRNSKARSGGKVSNSMRDIVEINPCGAYCRMPRCRFMHRVYRSFHFYEHFRKDHPEEARRRGLLQNVGPTSVTQHINRIPEINSALRPRSTLPLRQLVLEYISMDDDGIHCELTSGEPKCTYVQQNFNHPNFARHFCKKHPVEASLKGFCRGFLEGVLEKSVLKSSKKEVIPEKNKPRKAVLDYVMREQEGWRCRIAGPCCPFVRKVFVTEKFRRHFRLNHPGEAKEYGFFETLMQPKKGRGKILVQKQKVESEVQPMDTLSTWQSGNATENDENLDQKTPSEDPSEYCRLCFTASEVLKPIYDPLDGTDLAEVIETCTNVRLDSDVDHQSQICVGCRQKLHEIQRFQGQCQRLNNIVVRDRQEVNGAPIETALVDVEPAAAFLVEMIKTEPEDTIAVVQESPPSEEETDGELPYNQLETGWYGCRMCKRTFHSLTAMTAHLRNAHDQAEPPVPSTSAVEDESMSSFRVVMVGNVPYYKCTECDTLMRVRRNVLRHWRRFHRDDSRQGKRVYCAESGCGQFFMEGRAHKNHLEFFHGIRLLDYKAKYSE